jgi:hypothetical protein
MTDFLFSTVTENLPVTDARFPPFAFGTDARSRRHRRDAGDKGDPWSVSAVTRALEDSLRRWPTGDRDDDEDAPDDNDDNANFNVDDVEGGTHPGHAAGGTAARAAAPPVGATRAMVAAWVNAEHARAIDAYDALPAADRRGRRRSRRHPGSIYACELRRAQRLEAKLSDLAESCARAGCAPPAPLVLCISALRRTFEIVGATAGGAIDNANAGGVSSITSSNSTSTSTSSSSTSSSSSNVSVSAHVDAGESRARATARGARVLGDSAWSCLRVCLSPEYLASLCPDLACTLLSAAVSEGASYPEDAALVAEAVAEIDRYLDRTEKLTGSLARRSSSDGHLLGDDTGAANGGQGADPAGTDSRGGSRASSSDMHAPEGLAVATVDILPRLGPRPFANVLGCEPPRSSSSLSSSAAPPSAHQRQTMSSNPALPSTYIRVAAHLSLSRTLPPSGRSAALAVASKHLTLAPAQVMFGWACFTIFVKKKKTSKTDD